MRTSGTEPKIKYYAELCAPPGNRYDVGGGAMPLSPEMCSLVRNCGDTMLLKTTLRIKKIKISCRGGAHS